MEGGGARAPLEIALGVLVVAIVLPVAGFRPAMGAAKDRPGFQLQGGAFLPGAGGDVSLFPDQPELEGTVQ